MNDKLNSNRNSSVNVFEAANVIVVGRLKGNKVHYRHPESFRGSFNVVYLLLSDLLNLFSLSFENNC